MTEEELKKINKKIELLKKIKRTDNNIKEYAEAQCRLAQLYHYRIENYDKAKEHYLNVLKEDSAEW